MTLPDDYLRGKEAGRLGGIQEACERIKNMKLPEYVGCRSETDRFFKAMAEEVQQDTLKAIMDLLGG